MRLSVIVPALNEAEVLEAALGAAKKELAPGDEIIVVDGGSEDDTRAVAARLADRVLITEPGRGVQQHAGALEAIGDVLLFLHADTMLPASWRGRLANVWDASPKPALTAFRLGFDAPGAHYRLMERWALWRMKLTGVPHGDQAVAVAAAAYREAGGFPPVPLMEEYELRRRLRGRLVLIDGAVRTSARRYRRNGPIRNNLRNLLILFLYHVGVPPSRLARLYR